MINCWEKFDSATWRGWTSAQWQVWSSVCSAVGEVVLVKFTALIVSGIVIEENILNLGEKVTVIIRNLWRSTLSGLKEATSIIEGFIVETDVTNGVKTSTNEDRV